jgi:hypothetical protein
MGLKGYRLWVMGQLDSTCSAPPQEADALAQARVDHPGVAAAQVDPSERAALEYPGFHFYRAQGLGHRTGRFQAMMGLCTLNQVDP